MARMMYRARKAACCGCCTLYNTRCGRGYEKQVWQREWDDEQRSEDAEYEFLRRQTEERVQLSLYNDMYRFGGSTGQLAAS